METDDTGKMKDTEARKGMSLTEFVVFIFIFPNGM